MPPAAPAGRKTFPWGKVDFELLSGQFKRRMRAKPPKAQKGSPTRIRMGLLVTLWNVGLTKQIVNADPVEI